MVAGMNAAPVALAGRCISCGAVLSRYAEAGAVRCAPCDRRHREELEEPAGATVLDAEELMLSVAGELLIGAALRPGERIHLQAELELRGILTDNHSVHKAAEKLRRRYSWRIFAVEGEPGYRLDHWPYRFPRRPRRGQLQLFRG